MIDEGKRKFFQNLFREVVRTAVSVVDTPGAQIGTGTDDILKDFFDSYESSYALTLNYPDDILLETARLEGIPCEGREKIDIVRDLFRKKGGW